MGGRGRRAGGDMKISGGDKLERALREMIEKVTNASTVEVGFLENSTYPDGTSVPMVAAIQEFGSGNIPSRPFFRGMINDKSPEWPDAVAGLLVDNDYDAKRTLEQTGAAIKGQLQEAITEFVGVPLSPKTIARKGFDAPLRETGHMLNSVDYKVE